MNIAIVNRKKGNSGGQEVFTQILANACRRFSPTVKILTETSNTHFLRIESNIDVTSYKPIFSFADETFHSFNTYRKLKQQCKNATGIILNNPFYIFPLMALFSARSNKKAIIVSTFHGKGFSKNRIIRILNLLRIMLGINIASYLSNYLIFLTESDKTYFSQKIFGKSKAESCVIPNGVDITFFQKREKMHSSPFSVLFVGRLLKTKGVSDILTVAKKMSNQEIIFTFVGEGTLKKDIQKTPNCNALGKLSAEQLLAVYNGSDLFILPSYSECLPMTLLEAMACELPVITTRIYDLPTLVRDDPNQLINVGDSSDLEQKISYWFHNNNARKVAGAQNRAHVVQNYSQKMMIRQYQKLITNGQ